MHVMFYPLGFGVNLNIVTYYIYFTINHTLQNLNPPALVSQGVSISQPLAPVSQLLNCCKANTPCHGFTRAFNFTDFPIGFVFNQPLQNLQKFKKNFKIQKNILLSDWPPFWWHHWWHHWWHDRFPGFWLVLLLQTLLHTSWPVHLELSDWSSSKFQVNWYASCCSHSWYIISQRLSSWQRPQHCTKDMSS